MLVIYIHNSDSTTTSIFISSLIVLKKYVLRVELIILMEALEKKICMLPVHVQFPYSMNVTSIVTGIVIHWNRSIHQLEGPRVNLLRSYKSQIYQHPNVGPISFHSAERCQCAKKVILFEAVMVC